MPRVEFEVSERTIDTVKRIEERFQFHKIETTVTALNLFALALHAQEVEETSKSREKRITELLDAFFRDDKFFEYYGSTYGNRKLDFNRALHVVHHLGELSKFPWGSSPD